jgi:PP-loop superfamily ATP-utilizing enzyme
MSEQVEVRPFRLGYRAEDHIERQYRFCEKHGLAYSTRSMRNSVEKKYNRLESECYYCFRERLARLKAEAGGK